MGRKLQMALLKVWHAWLAGGFLVAYLTANEDTYAMHQFAGYAVLVAIVLRLLVGVVVTWTRAPGQGGLWALPRLRAAALKAWVVKPQGRSPVFAWMAAALLAAIGAAALLGALADGIIWLEGPHEALSQLSLWVIAGHIAFVIFIYGRKKLMAWALTLWRKVLARPSLMGPR
jgi:cytochrome b